MKNLQSNQILGAIDKRTVEAKLRPMLLDINGDEKVVDENRCGIRLRAFVRFDVTEVDVKLQSPYIVFDDFEIDVWPGLRLDIDLNELWDCLLFGRCYEVCIPGTNICAKKCFDIGSASTGRVEIPTPIDLTGLYKPSIYSKDDKYIIYPELDFIANPILIDVDRMIELLCAKLSQLLPWPLSKILEEICETFAGLIDFIEDFLSHVAVDLAIWLFEKTDGWIGIKLKFVSLYEIDQNKFPGTGTSPTNPAIPVRIEFVEKPSIINSADELQLSFFVYETP